LVITPEGLSIIERKAGILEMKTLRKLAVLLEQPIWYLGCFENMPEDTFFEKLEKARCYHKLEILISCLCNYNL
jgi:hypothetical protein